MLARKVMWPSIKGQELPVMKELGAKAKEAAG